MREKKRSIRQQEGESGGRWGFPFCPKISEEILLGRNGTDNERGEDKTAKFVLVQGNLRGGAEEGFKQETKTKYEGIKPSGPKKNRYRSYQIGEINKWRMCQCHLLSEMEDRTTRGQVYNPNTN